MNKTWQLHDAKNKFSEVVDWAINQGAQSITWRGKRDAADWRFCAIPAGTSSVWFRTRNQARQELLRTIEIKP